jgi:class 3 adenylate cyclase
VDAELPEFLPDEIRKVDGYRTSRKVSLLTILFADIVGYTTLCERLPEKKVARILRRFEDLTEDVLQTRRGGLIVKRIGDAVLAVFAEPTSAVLAALELHAAIDEAPVEGEALQLRSGVHVGQVAIERSGIRVDVLGRHVNRTARVQAAAEPGEVLVTEPVADNVRGFVDDSQERPVGFGRRSVRLLKGIDEPVTVLAAEYVAPGASPASSHPAIHLVLAITESGKTRDILIDADRDPRALIGRDKANTIPIQTKAASRQHAVLFVRDGAWIVTDLDTTNGTLVNGDRIRSATLREGDELRIGDTRLLVKRLAAPTAPTARASTILWKPDD